MLNQCLVTRLVLGLVLCMAIIAGAFAPPHLSAAAIGLPGIPGLPNPNNVIKGAAAQQLINALNKTIFDNQPIRSSADKAYPTVPTLPGPSFIADRTGGKVSVNHDGALTLGPGDYTLTVQTFCMKYTSHSPQSNTFHLAPLQGKWADIIAAVQSRAVAAGVPHRQIQVLSWQLQAGLKYQELSPLSKSLVDRFIPEFRPRLNQSFYEQIQATWSRASSTIPGVPSMDSMLDQLGDAGRFIRELENARNTLLSDADDYNSIARIFVQPPKGGPEAVESTAWSVIGDRLYARFINPGNFLGPGELELRVLPAPHASRPMTFQVASLGNAPFVRSVADAGPNVGFPAGANVGVPGADVQPLGIAPEPPSPGPSPSPTPSCETPPYGSGNDGVPGGDITRHPFHAVTVGKVAAHPGIDDFAPRDTPVYADLQPTVPVDDLNNAGIYHKPGASLNISETGNLQLVDAKVWLQPWDKPGDDYGGIVRLVARYQGDSGKIYTIDIDYLHLINKSHHPRNDAGEPIDNAGKPIAEDAYKGCVGFGPEMQNGKLLSKDELAKHPRVGYLGATQTSHTHIQATFAGNNFDPASLLASN